MLPHPTPAQPDTREPTETDPNASRPDPTGSGAPADAEPAEPGTDASPEGAAAGEPVSDEAPVESATTRVTPNGAPEHTRRVRALVALGVLAVLLVAGAVLLAVANHAARTNGPLANSAFVDTAATGEVAAQVTAAIQTIYSYDFTKLDANQAAAKEVITGPFAEEFDKVFAPVRQLAPQQQAVLTTTVPAAGVLQLQGDRARLLMMVDQRGTRAGSQPIAGTSARLVVDAQRVDGSWKITEVTPE